MKKVETSKDFVKRVTRRTLLTSNVSTNPGPSTTRTRLSMAVTAPTERPSSRLITKRGTSQQNSTASSSRIVTPKSIQPVLPSPTKSRRTTLSRNSTMNIRTRLRSDQTCCNESSTMKTAKTALVKTTQQLRKKDVAVQTEERFDSREEMNTTFLQFGIECPICFETMYRSHLDMKRATVIGSCGHCVCWECACAIAETKPLCPLCLSKINKTNFCILHL